MKNGQGREGACESAAAMHGNPMTESHVSCFAIDATRMRKRVCACESARGRLGARCGVVSSWQQVILASITNGRSAGNTSLPSGTRNA